MLMSLDRIQGEKKTRSELPKRVSPSGQQLGSSYKVGLQNPPAAATRGLHWPVQSYVRNDVMTTLRQLGGHR